MAFERLPKPLLRLIRYPPQLAYAIGLGPLLGRYVLLLTTIGRKSGLKRVTPLQYEEQNGVIYVGAARGAKADWFRNIVANPQVVVRVRNRQFSAQAEAITDTKQIADFLELRLARHPRMIGAMMKGESLPAKPNRAQLEQYAKSIAMVAIKL
jgi:deazaflavin-dependent oxidoreductase (nitroreductase family)